MTIKSDNTTNSQNYFWIKFLMATLCVSLVSSCSGRKDVVTQDDSAEYREARTLPPLKKTSSEGGQGSVVTQPQVQAQPEITTQAPKSQPSALSAAPISATVVEKKGNV